MNKKNFEYLSYAIMGIVLLCIILMYTRVIPMQYFTAVAISCTVLIVIRFILKFYIQYKDKKTE